MARSPSTLILRLGYIKYWNAVWCVSFKNFYSTLTQQDDILLKYLGNIFTKQKKILYALFHYGFSKIYRIYYTIYIFIYLRSKIWPRLPQIIKLKKVKYNANFQRGFTEGKQKKSILHPNYILSSTFKKNYILLSRCLIFLHQHLVLVEKKKTIQKYTYIFTKYFRWWLTTKYILSKIKTILNLTIQNCFFRKIQPRIFFVLLVKSVFVLTSALIIRFISAKLRTNFPLFQVLKFILRCLNYGISQRNLSGFKIMFSGRSARRGRSRFIWKTSGTISSSNINSKIDYALGLVILINSVCGIKIWLTYNEEQLKYAIL